MIKNNIKNQSGQVIVIVIAIVMIFVILIPLHVYLLTQESKWTIKEKRSTVAFHLAEAGIDRGYWKVTEKTENFDNFMKGINISGYDFSTTFTDVPGGAYKINISSVDTGETDKQVIKITSIGRDESTNEIRAIEATYKKTLGIESAVTVGGSQEWKKGFWVHWAPVTSFGSIDLKGDTDDVYWPKRYTKGMIDPWDLAPPTNLFPGGSTEVAEDYCGWAFKDDLADPPEIDLNYYREKAKATIIPYPNSANGGTISSNKDPYKIPAGPYAGYNTGYFPDSTSTEFKGYQWTNSTGVFFFEVSKNVKLDDGGGGRKAFLRVEALISALGNAHLHSDGITNYAVNVPVNAWKQYLAGKPRTPPNTADHITPDTAAVEEYPGDNGLHTVAATYTMPGIFDDKKYTKNTINATGVAFHGFFYSGAERQHCGGGKNIIVGCIYAKGGLDVDTIIIYYDADIGKNVKLSVGGLTRTSWHEITQHTF